MKNTFIISFILLICFQQTVVQAQCTPPIFKTQCGNGLTPYAQFCSGSSKFCVGALVCLEANSSGTNTADSVFIDWGDTNFDCDSGAYLNPDVATHTYNYPFDSCVFGADAGLLQININISLKDTCAAGYSSYTFSLPVYLEFAPHAGFIYQDTVCIGEPVSFNGGNGCGGAGWTNSSDATVKWYFGDGDSAIVNATSNAIGSVVHTYITTGSFTVTQIIQKNDTSGCDYDAISHTIFVLPPAQIYPTVTATSCAPDTFPAVLNGLNVDSVLWSINNGGSLLTLPNDTQPMFAAPIAGDYIVHVQAFTCCFPPFSICYWEDTLHFDNAPLLTSKNPLPVLCDSGDVNPLDFFNITDIDTIITGYHWIFSGTIPDDFTPTPPMVHYSSPGVYPITLIVISPCGNDTITDSLHVYAPPVINITTSPLIDCDSIGVTFTNNIVAPQTYSWNAPAPGFFIAPTTSTSASPIISYNVVNSYDVIVTASTNAICPVAKDTFTITVQAGPDLQVTSVPDSCNTSSFDPSTYFTINGIATTYNWQFVGGTPNSDNTSNPPPVQYPDTGNYIITLTVSSALCGADSVADTFRVSKPPIINIIPDSLSGCGTLTVDFTNTSPSGQTYSWTSAGTFVLPSTNTSASPSIFYNTPPQNDNITVVAHTNGCVDSSKTFAITLGDAPQLSLTAPSNFPIPDDCDTNKLIVWNNYFVWPAGSPDNYAWNLYLNGAIVYSSNTLIPSNYQLSDSGTYIISANATNGCGTITLADTFRIFIPGALSIPNDTVLCKDNGVYNLVASPVGGNWYLNHSTTPLAVAEFNPYTATQSINFILYAFAEGTNCEARDSFTITISGLNVTAGSDVSTCGNVGVDTLTGAIPSGGVYSGTGIIDATLGIYNPAAISGSSSIVYAFTDVINNCVTRDTLILSINQLTAGTTLLPDTVCKNDTITLSNSAANTTSYWNYGDATGQFIGDTVYHFYADSGKFIVTLITENAAMCRDTLKDTITVFARPNATFALDTATVCSGAPVIIYNYSVHNGYTTYVWNYANGTALDTTYYPDTIYFQQTAGANSMHTISLITSNICGTNLANVSITVIGEPKSLFGFAQGDGCSPDTVEFSNISTGSYLNYQWFVNGTFITTDSALSNQIFTADTVPKKYYVLLVATNECGVDSIVDTVTVNPSSTNAFFSLLDPIICLNDSAQMISYSTPGSYVYWDFGDNLNAHGDTVSHIYAAPGNYTITQIAYNCGTDTMRRTVTVNNIPDAQLSVSLANCMYDTVRFYNNSTSINNFGSTWFFGDGDSSHISEPNHHYNATGNYTVSLFITDAVTQCYDVAYDTISILPYPQASFSIPNLNGCEHTIHPQNNSTGATNYFWNMGNSIIINDFEPTYTYPDTGRYTITLTASDNTPCSDDTSFSYVTILPIPNASFTPMPAQQNILTPLFHFKNNSSGDSIISYTWNFDDGTLSFDFEPDHIYGDMGTYTVQLIAINNYGCTDTAYNAVTVIPFTTVYMPTAFTPNNDTKNEVFKIYGCFDYAGCDIREYNLQIYSRWGRKVFETDNHNVGWDGTYYSGKPAEEGIYTYRLHYVANIDGDIQDKVIRKTFVLVR